MSIRSAIARLATTALTGALLASPAAAQLTSPSSGCGGILPGEYNLCYSISNVNYTVGGTTLSLTLANATDLIYGATHMSTFLVSGIGSAHTVTGISGLPAGYDAIYGTTSNSLGFGGAGLIAGQNFIGFDYNGNAGILDGTSANITFQLGQAIQAGDFTNANIQLAMMVQGAQVGSCASTKGVFSGSGVRADGTADYSAPGMVSCNTPPVTPTPEPASLALLGSGLLAIGGMGLRRRRATV